MTLMKTFYFTHGGREFCADVFHDRAADAPWDSCDGHGPVTDWTTRDKRPGEMLLFTDGRRKRFYDYAEACRIARRDGWGFTPGRLTLREHGGKWYAGVKPRTWTEQYEFPPVPEFSDVDVNAAIRAVYAHVRSTMTARQIAAYAVRDDFRRLRAWCLDEWSYVGVRVSAVNWTGASEALWGIESDDEEGIQNAARELADQVIEILRERSRHLGVPV